MENKAPVKDGKEDPNKDKDAKIDINQPQEKPEPVIEFMKKGDYTVHILIIEIKSVETKDKDKGACPVVKMTSFGETQRTKKIENQDSYFYAEHFYFEKENLSLEELDSSKLLLEVYDSNFTDKKDYIGIYETDVNSIYRHKDHSLTNFWIGLANPQSDDFTKIRGYLRLSISVLHQDDKRVELIPEKNDSSSSNLIIPPQITLKYIQLKFHFLEAYNLPDMDGFLNAFKKPKKYGECDGFITIEFMGIKLNTSVSLMKKNVCTWNETIQIPVSTPVVSNRIKMTVWDKDPTTNEIIGAYEFDMNDILLRNVYKDWRFVHIYGAPISESRGFSAKMNENPEIGSLWKGKIFMKVEYDNNHPKPKTMISPMDDEIKKQAYKRLEESYFWTLEATIYDAYFLPKDGLYTIAIYLENNFSKSLETQSVNRCINFNGFKFTPIKAQSSLDDPKSLGDLYIYLIKDGKNICFQRFTNEVFLNNEDIFVIKLLPDPAIGVVNQSRKAGMLKMQICLKKKIFNGIESNNQSFMSDNYKIEIADPKLIIPSYRMSQSIKRIKNFVVLVNIHQSRYLIAGDSEGTSDPYVKIKIGGNLQKTTTKNDTINPIWNETLVFENVQIDISDQISWPVLYLECMDQDFLLPNDDCLGYSYIWLSETKFSFNEYNEEKLPHWYQLYLPISNKPQGQLLMSFIIMDQDKFNANNLKDQISIAPKTKLYSAEINVIGLRELQPLHLIPVKRPYILFDVNSIDFRTLSKKSKTGSTLKKIIKTQPKEAGSNPSINIVLRFEVNLPILDIFMPSLQCMVNDLMLSGFVNQLLGIFTIPIKQVIKNHTGDFEVDLLLLKKNCLKFEKEIKDKKYSTFVKGKGKKLLQLNAIENEEHKGEDEAKETLISKENGERREKKIVSNKPAQTLIPDENKIVLRPEYKKYVLPGVKENSKNFKEYDIEDYSKRPDNREYMEIGFNSSINDNTLFKKHFRKRVGCELESANLYGMKSPFDKYPVTRGKYADNSNESQIFESMRSTNLKIFKRIPKVNESLSAEEQKALNEQIQLLNKSDENQKNIDSKDYGCFKGLIRFLEKEKVDEADKMIEELTSIGKYVETDYPHINQYHTLAKELLEPKDVVVRLYIIKIDNIKEKDLLSASDPYLKIKLGKQVIDDVDNHGNDLKSMRVCRKFDLFTKLPGVSNLRIELWDWDAIFPNELIGYTDIDIEDRFYDKNWKNLPEKPLETRILKHPDLKGIQGELVMWLEVFEKSKRETIPVWDISPPPRLDFEVRVIIYETRGVADADIEGVTDLYVSVFLDENNKCSTDIHYRSQGGEASFNWRMLLPTTFANDNEDKTNLKIQLFDNDLITKDDYLCGANFEIGNLLRDCYFVDLPLKIDENYIKDMKKQNPNEPFYNDIVFEDSKDSSKFWLQLWEVEGTEKKPNGQVHMSLEVLPKWKAEISKVGKGREEPNVNPFLPPPTGRFEFSMNPFRMINQLVGPKVRAKIYGACCLIICVMLCLVVFPTLIGVILNPFNYVTKTVNCNVAK